jgi:Outer membrane protein beta-barrel domain
MLSPNVGRVGWKWPLLKQYRQTEQCHNYPKVVLQLAKHLGNFAAELKFFMMKKLSFLLISLLLLSHAHAQHLGLGFKAGYNFANIKNVSSLNAESKSGYHLGAFFSPGQGKKIIGFRTELIYSKQGYDFKSGNKSGTVELNYLLLPQMFTFNITKLIQLQAGGQLAFLLNAKADSSVSGGPQGQYQKVIDFYNKIDYGITAGAEVHPYKGLLLGVRYNTGLSNLFKDQQVVGGPPNPSFISSLSSLNFKSNVIQVFVGWRL